MYNRILITSFWLDAQNFIVDEFILVLTILFHRYNEDTVFHIYMYFISFLWQRRTWNIHLLFTHRLCHILKFD